MSPTHRPARMGTSVNLAGVLRAASSFRPGGLRSTCDRAGQRCVPSARHRSGATPPPLPGFSFSKASRRLRETESRGPGRPTDAQPVHRQRRPLPAATNWAIATPAVAHGGVGDSGRGPLLSRLSSHDMSVAAARRCGYFRDKLDHLTSAVSGDCSTREGATVSARVGGPAHQGLRNVSPRTEDRPLRVARGPGKSARPPRRPPGPAAAMGRSPKQSSAVP